MLQEIQIQWQEHQLGEEQLRMWTAQNVLREIVIDSKPSDEMKRAEAFQWKVGVLEFKKIDLSFRWQ
jgi:hypothetical protein